MNLQQELARRVRDGLTRNGMTQRDLAESADLSEKHVSQMLAGKSGTICAWDRLLEAINRADILTGWFEHVATCPGCPAPVSSAEVCATCGGAGGDRRYLPGGLHCTELAFHGVSSGEAGTGEAGSQWEQMLRDPNGQFDVNGEVAQVILDTAGWKPHRLLGGPWAGIQHEAWLSGECGNTIEEPVQITTASARPSKPTTWIADLCGLPKGHDGDCVKRGDLPAPVVAPSDPKDGA